MRYGIRQFVVMLPSPVAISSPKQSRPLAGMKAKKKAQMNLCFNNH